MNLSERSKKPLLIVAALVAAGIAATSIRCPEPPPSPPKPVVLPVVPREAGPAELALVAPLKKGDKLLDYDVTAINGVEKGVIHVILGKGEGSVDFTIALASDAGPLAPVTAGPYAIFSSRRGAPPDDTSRLMAALLEILKPNVGVPVPPGLSSYTMDPPPVAPPAAPPQR